MAQRYRASSRLPLPLPPAPPVKPRRSPIPPSSGPAPPRRTYRAHGRINAYMSSPCHIELILAERDQTVKAEAVSGRCCCGCCGGNAA